MSNLSPLSGSPASIKNEIMSSSTDTPSTTALPVFKTANKSKPRKRVNTAEKRHQHNAIERQRRETLNGKFLSLARLLPALATSRRPSKSAIVNGSITHLTYQRDQRLLAAKLLRRLAAEHDALLNEVNEWRKSAGFPVKDVQPAWTEEMDEVSAVEKEIFGNFAGFDGDDNDNDDDDVAPIDQALEAANRTAANFTTNALIAPRSSAEIDAFGQRQVMFTGMPSQDRRINLGMNNVNWSHDFAFNHSSNGMSNSVSSASSVPFGAFMSDSLDVSSTGSPSNSVVGGLVLTPPTTADAMLYNHTPSPRSSSSGPDDKITPIAAQQQTQWAVLLQQQQQQQQQLRMQRQAQHAQAMATSGGGFNLAATTNMFSGMFPQQQAAQNLPLLAAQQQQAPTTEAFTQQLLASVFPQNGVSADQVDQWRKLALSGMPQQVPDLSNIGRSNSGHSLNMAAMWENRAVEGF